jgi:HK97 gp10 family phage protein
MPKDDLASVLRSFKAIPPAVRKAVRPAIDKGADELVSRMQYLAPEGEGQLKQGIGKEPIDELGVRVVASDTSTSGGGDNALFQEYGTANMDRNPFFWPSVNTLKKRVRSRIDRAISKAAKDHWNKT